MKKNPFLFVFFIMSFFLLPRGVGQVIPHSLHALPTLGNPSGNMDKNSTSQIGGVSKSLSMSCDNWLYLPANPSHVGIGQLNITGNQLTVEANINRTTPYVYGDLAAGDIVGKYRGPADVNYLLRPDNGYITTTDGTFYATPNICQTELNKTYHIAMVYDGTSLKFYRNGFLMSQIPATGNMYQNNYETEIGLYLENALPAQFFGYINEVRIWNVARTQSQIQAYMDSPLPSPSTQTGLLAYYTFDNLLNKQGNAAWNGTLNGSASLNATNPTCASFVADNDCCPALQGTLAGSTVCQGVSPTLTFSATGGTAPFTLTYTDGINAYTQSNVQSGVPFVVPNMPTTNTTYTLTSIQDASGCPATVVSGLSTGSNAIVNGDFNNGNSGFASDYGYSTSGLPPGVYFVGTDPVAWNPGMAPCHDHTTGNGNMMLVNGAEQTNTKVWTETIPVTPNTDYQFSTWLETITTVNPALLQFSINGTTIGNIFQANSSPCIWNQFYTTWNSGSNTNATISILNMNQSFTGNDFALDDIFFAPITTLNNSAQITVQNCVTALCTGSLGDPVVNITFGSGNNPGPSLPVAVPGASSNLTFLSVTGNPATPTPQDGQYTITNNIPYNVTNWLSGAPNHTPNDPNGYMIFYNPGITPGEFYRQTINNLCGSGTYEFAAWIANADNPAVLNGIKPDLTFVVERTDGTYIASYGTGPIQQNYALTWAKYGFYFTLPSDVSTVVLRIIDNNPGGYAQPGNDFAMDDITFRPCGPKNTASFNATAILDSIAACEGSSATVYGTISAGYLSPAYLWQQSSDSGRTWADIANSNSLQLTIKTPITGKSINYEYRMLAADGNSINSASCRVTSNLINFTSLSGPATDFVFDQSTCNPLHVDFSSANQAGVTYVWTVNGADYPGNSNLTQNFPQPGAYPVKLKATDATGCADSTTSNIPIQLQKGDIINTGDTTICAGHSIQLLAKTALEYCWTPTPSLDNAALANPTASPTATTTYYLSSKTIGTSLIVNGDFSGGNTGFNSSYTYTPANQTAGEYFVGTNPANWNPGMSPCKDHTTGNGTGNMLLINGAVQLNVAVWSETVTVQPNTNYAFSAWIQNISTLNPAVLQFSISGQPLGNQIYANVNGCVWNNFYTTWNSGNASTAVISIVNENQGYSGNDFALDDISFAPVTLQQDSVVVTIENTAVTAFPDTTVCHGSPVTLNAVGSLAISPYTYSWAPSGGLSDSTSPNPVALPSATTSYTITATTAHGCVAKASLMLTLFPPVSIGLTPDTTICPGTILQLQASGGNVYSWAPAQYLDNPLSNAPQTIPPDTTLFFVTVTDLNHCSAKDSVHVDVRPPVTFKAPPDEVICKGSTVVLKSTNNENYAYAWSPGDGLSDPAAPFPNASPAATTLYAVNISDPVCGHDSNFNVTITVKPIPDVKAQKANDIDCAVTTSQLSATGASDYLWTPDEGLDNPHIPTPIASIDSTTTFIVQGTDENGCSAFDTLTVKVTATGHNRFIVPNAFTPNGDGRNDCFGIRRWGDVRIEEFSIYNRWGGRVFTTRNPSDCWDGYFNGKPQEAGGYVYTIRAWSFCGEITRKGVVMLVR